jgi:uncharacterized membrane protein
VKSGDPFTEFYILGLSGKADDYPTDVKVNESASVILGIVNREHVAADYRVEIYIDSLINNEIGPITLVDEEKWEEVVSFTPYQAGDDQKVEFLLYKGQEQDNPYLTLRLRVDVTGN